MSDRPCRSCDAAVGQPHEDGCDVARCLWTGGQRIQCAGDLAAECCRALRASGRDDLGDDLADYLSLDDPDHDCGNDVWSGEWPGKADASRLGFFCYWGQSGWVQCDAEHPEATPDLNRLVVEGQWDRASGQWVKH